jgi:hypothetical protein
MLYQLVLQSSTEPKHSVQRDLHLPRDQKQRITSLVELFEFIVPLAIRTDDVDWLFEVADG